MKKQPFTDVELSKWDSNHDRLPEHETLMQFVNDGGNYAFNEWWYEQGQYLFNEWCKYHDHYHWEYCDNKGE